MTPRAALLGGQAVPGEVRVRQLEDRLERALPVGLDVEQLGGRGERRRVDLPPHALARLLPPPVEDVPDPFGELLRRGHALHGCTTGPARSACGPENVPDPAPRQGRQVLDELPLSSNGKVDRKALPEPPAEPGERALRSPRDEVEAAVAEILAGTTGRIKNVLTDQHTIAGIGNAYSDEILHTAKLSPFASSKTLKADQVATLYDAMRGVLTDAIRHSRGMSRVFRVLLGRHDGVGMRGRHGVLLSCSWLNGGSGGRAGRMRGGAGVATRGGG